VVPLELDEVYPLSQHETAMPLDEEVVDYVAKQVAQYVGGHGYRAVVLLDDPETFGNAIRSQCKRACAKKNVLFSSLDVKGQTIREFLVQFDLLLKRGLGIL
jgi:hypothetical protein